MVSKKRFKPGHCYAITYTDHYANPSDVAWVSQDSIKADDCTICTVGWVVKETKLNVSLAQTVDPVWDTKKTVGNVWTIVKSTITKSKRIDPP